MITKIVLENYKSFGKKQTIDLSNLTIFSGLNSSGKSSIYQVLLLLLQSKDSLIRFGEGEVPVLSVNGTYLKAGRKSELLFDENNPNLYFEIHWSEGDSIQLTYTLYTQNIDGDTVEEFLLSKSSYSNQEESNLTVELDLESKRWSLTALSAINFSSAEFGGVLDKYIRTQMKSEEKEFLYNSKVEFKNLERLNFWGSVIPSLFSIPLHNASECLNPIYRHYFDLENFKEKLASKDAQYDTISMLTSEPIRLRMNSQFAKVQIVELPAFRGYPQRIYTEGLLQNPLVEWIKRKNQVIPYAYNFETKTILRAPLKEALNYWVSEHFELAKEVQINEILSDYATEIILKIDDKNVSINNVGFGASQLLPIIFKLITDQNSLLIIVDEPEIHLHPKMQSRLGDFFCHMAAIGKNILLETHSELLLHKFIYYKVYSSDLSSKMKLQWVEKNKEGSFARDIVSDELGFITNSPEGFLDERNNLTKQFNELRTLRLKSSK